MALILRQLLLLCPSSHVSQRSKYGRSPLHIVANNSDENQVRPGMIRSLAQAKAFLEERLGTSLETEVRNASPSMRLDLSPEVAEKFRRKFDYEFALYEGIGANGDYTPLPGDVTRAG